MKYLTLFLGLVSSLLAVSTDSLENEIVYTPPPVAPEEMQIPLPAFETASRKNSFASVGLSALLPGLGHVYLGDLKTAGALLGTTGTSLGLGMGLNSSSASKDFIRTNSLLTLQNTWFYGLYAAYRDTRKHNGFSGYSYQMPIDNFVDLVYAPFNLKILKKPEVWGGVLGSLAAAAGIGYLAFSEKAVAPSLSVERLISPLAALPVGIGEEAVFRGFVQSVFSELINPWAGIAISSFAFGAIHIPNAAGLERSQRLGYYKFVVPFIALSGIYDGWITYKNRSLKESVAMHTWYDFVLFSLGALTQQKISKGRMDLALAFSF